MRHEHDWGMERGDPDHCTECCKEQIEDRDAELARLRAKYNAMAAENRVMREALRLAHAHLGWGDVSLENVHKDVQRALSQPHTAREVERVKLLESVVEAARRFAFHEPLKTALDALTKADEKRPGADPDCSHDDKTMTHENGRHVYYCPDCNTTWTSEQCKAGDWCVC